MNWTQAAFIGVGGAIGAMARSGVREAAANAWGELFPWGTMTVNITGAFAAGLVSGLLARYSHATPWRDLLVAGFLGGYTTFSAFELDILGLLRSGARWEAAAYASASLLGGFIAVIAGALLAEWLGGRTPQPSA